MLKFNNSQYRAPNLLGNQTDPSYSNGEESDAIFYDARMHTDQESDFETAHAKSAARSKPASILDKTDVLLLINEENKEEDKS